MDPESFEPLGRWEVDRGSQRHSYDGCWHLGYDTMVTSEWGTPVGLHMLAMIAVAGAIAVAVYEWIGVGILRRAWVNLDLVWSAALLACGALLLARAGWT